MMRTNSILILLLLLISGQAFAQNDDELEFKETVFLHDLTEYEGVYYLGDLPYYGTAFGKTPEGQITFEAFFIAGQPDGHLQRWTKDGVRILYSNYKEGKREGVIKAWFPNGQLSLDSYYKNDMLHGQFITYDQNGNELRNEVYENGIIVDEDLSARSYIYAGQEWLRQKEYGMAAANFAKAAELEPDNFDAWYWKGVANESAKDTLAAMADYQKALEIDPSSSEATRVLAVAYHKQGDYEQAKPLYQQYLEMDVSELEQARTWNNLGDIALENQNTEGAIDAFTNSLEIKDSGNTAITAYYSRAQAYTWQQQQDKACADWKAAAKLGNMVAKEKALASCGGY